MRDIMTEFPSLLLSPTTFLGAAIVLGVLGTLNYCFGAKYGLGLPRRRYRPPVTKGQIHLFDDDGEGHFLSAKMSTVGLEQLLKDRNRRRFG
jgi:hypothetical protein